MPDGMHIVFFGSLIVLVISIEELIRGAVSSARRSRQEQEGTPKLVWYRDATTMIWLAVPVVTIMGTIVSGTEIHVFPGGAVNDVTYFLFAFIALILFVYYGILRFLEKRRHRKEDACEM
jgi:hypothetical protein